jgi:hypothetical protein
MSWILDWLGGKDRWVGVKNGLSQANGMDSGARPPFRFTELRALYCTI